MRANPAFEPPRDSWFWSARVEELYQKHVCAAPAHAPVPLERSGACSPDCNCVTLGILCGDAVNAAECCESSARASSYAPDRRTDPVYPEGPLSKEQLLEKIGGCERLIAYS